MQTLEMMIERGDKIACGRCGSENVDIDDLCDDDRTFLCGDCCHEIDQTPPFLFGREMPSWDCGR